MAKNPLHHFWWWLQDFGAIFVFFYSVNFNRKSLQHFSSNEILCVKKYFGKYFSKCTTSPRVVWPTSPAGGPTALACHCNHNAKKKCEM